MAAAERMRAMRERRHARGLRELRLVVPDARSKAIRRRVAREVAGLDRARELAALGWIEAAGDYGKPRPAVIVHTDAFPASHASVVVCQMTSECSDAPDFRVTVDPTATNGLRVRSQVMADKPVTIRRERIGRRIGHLDDQDIARLNVALAFVMGLAD